MSRHPLAFEGVSLDYSYMSVPFIAWLVTGCVKFGVNFLKARKAAFTQIGYGGFPSNHSAIVSSITMLIALKEGVNNPAFGVSLTLAFIVILDANSLRREVGKHATAINDLFVMSSNTRQTLLRERMGHSILEIFGGVLVGCAVAFGVNALGISVF